MISDTYLENLQSFPDVEVLILGDLDVDRARAQADKHGVPAAGTVADVLAHPGVELVINLTIPAVHVEVSSAAIAAGKHVWSEKPIGIDRESALALLQQADAAGLRVGIAPDTVLGPGIQSAKRAIERGDIGRPLFAQTSMQYQGPEVFHPNPAFLYAHGAGPLFDMGPYYLTSLVSILGPVAAVAAVGLKPSEEREILVGPDAGKTFPVEVPSTINVLATFEGGAQSQSLLSFDSPLRRQGFFEISGTEGTIVLPDPNMFTGRAAITRPVQPPRRRPGHRRGHRAAVDRRARRGRRGRPRPGRARHGPRDPHGPPAPRHRRARLPRARHDGLGAGVRGARRVRHRGEHGRPDRGRAGRLRPVRPHGL